jgi:hypothetical protein
MLCAGLLVGNTSPVVQWTAQSSYGASLGAEMSTRGVPMRVEWESRHWNGTQGDVAVRLGNSRYLPPETKSTNQITGGTVDSSSPVTNDDPLKVSKSL